MKFKVGDKVLVTVGKDKGKKAKIVKVLPMKNQVVVEGVNLYIKHIKPYGERSGDRIRKEGPLSTAKIAIINDQGQPDRIKYLIAKDGSKERTFSKTQQLLPEPKDNQKKVSKTKK